MAEPNFGPRAENERAVGAGVTVQKTDGLAIASMVLGIVSIPTLALCVGFIVGIVGAVLGLVSMSRIKKSGGSIGGRGQAIAGVSCSFTTIGLTVLYLVGVLISYLT
jgi:hypothetical protein